MTVPAVPSIVSRSPSRSTCPASVAVPARSSNVSASQPLTHDLPIPRATTAACEVAPPRAVSTPREAIMPCTSSGVVSLRTRITDLPSAAHLTAVSGSNTICPAAAPGEAFRPRATTLMLGRIDARVEELIERRRVDPARRASAPVDEALACTKSSAIFTAASALRLPLRVCSM